MKRETRPFRNRYIFSTPNMAPEPHIAFSHRRFTTIPKRAPDKEDADFQGKTFHRYFLLFYRKRGSNASPIENRPWRPTPVSGREHRVISRTPCRPADPEEQHFQAVHADIQRAVKVLQGLTCRNAPPRLVPERRGIGSD